MADSGLPSGLLDRFALVTVARGARTGERSTREAGSSLEFLDYRPYQEGDEPRAVDWRAYARSGRLYTRVYEAERAAEVHVLLDTSPSMRLHGKDRFAAATARLLMHMARGEASGRVHLLDGRPGPVVRSGADLPAARRFVAEAPTVEVDEDVPLADALARLVLGLPAHPGAAVLIVLSDLLDPGPLRPALNALRARRVDAVFVQLLAAAELDPPAGAWELRDVERDDGLEVGPDEVRAYREAVRGFVRRVRAEVASAGGRHLLIEVPAAAEAPDAPTRDLERVALGELLRSGVVARR